MGAEGHADSYRASNVAHHLCGRAVVRVDDDCVPGCEETWENCHTEIIAREGEEKLPMKFIPLNDRVLVERKVEEVAMSEGGLVIPEQAREKPAEGLVLSVGPGRILENGVRLPMNISEGDVVLFGKYSGTDIRLDRQDRLILREDEILGILREGA